MMRKACLTVVLAACGTAQARVLLYDGFYFDPHDSTAYTTEKVSGAPTAQIVGFLAAKAWSGSGVIGLDSTQTLVFPAEFADVGLVPIGGSQQFQSGSSPTDGRGVQRESGIYYDTWNRLGPEGSLGPSLYMRTLMKIDAKAVSTLGEGSYYGIGLSRGNSSLTSSAARFLSDTGCWFAFKKSNGVVSLVSKVGAADYTLVGEVEAGATYIAVARLDVGQAQAGGSDAVSAYAATVDAYDPAFEFADTGLDVPIARGDSLKSSGSERFIYASVCGQYGPGTGRVWFDEFALATEVGDVVLKRTRGASRIVDAAVGWDGVSSLVATGVLADNPAREVSLVTRTADGEVVNERVVAGTVEVGAPVRAVVDPQDPERTYDIAFVSRNAVAAVTDEVSTVYFAQPVLARVSDGLFTGEVPAELTVSRATAERLPLEIGYAVTSDDAQPGVHYVAPSGKITIPAGEKSATISLKPIYSAAFDRDVVLSVALTDGGYFGGAESAEVKIACSSVPEEYNVWMGRKGLSDGLASTAENWSKGVPKEDQDILVDGDWGTADIIWDAGVNGLPSTVAKWEQRASYAGTVTFLTKFPSAPDAAFTVFGVTGNVALDGGTWTCPVSFEEVDPEGVLTLADLRAGRTYRLSVRAGAMTVGPGGALDVTGKGHRRTRADKASLGTLVSSHGGTTPDSTLGAFGSLVAPDDIAPAAVFRDTQNDALLLAAGGGAIRVDVVGSLVVNGAVRADGDVSPFVANDKMRVAAAGGSVWITARSVTGVGAITANAGDNGNVGKSRIGTGGRVSVVATETVSSDTLRMSAGYAHCWRGGASGTVYWKDAALPNGKLGLLNREIAAADGYIYGRGCVTPMTGDWTFDGIEIFGPALLEVGTGRTLALPNGFASVGSSDTVARGGLLVTDGALAAGGGPQTLQGGWIFATTNFTFDCDVTVRDGAVLGLPVLHQKAASKTVPMDFLAFRCTVNGNLDIQSTGGLNADRCGLCYVGGGNLPSNISVNGHGGRSAGAVAYDSCIDPQLPGIETYSGDYGDGFGDIRLSGGYIGLTVTGTFNMDGKATVLPCSYGSVNSAGAINIRAGRLTGRGSISANASGSHTAGIVAVRLTDPDATFDDFSGSITARRAGGSNGLVYRQTAADGEGGGILTVDGSGTTVPVQLPAAGYGSDGTVGLSRTKIVFVNGGRAEATLEKERIGEMSLSSGALFDLKGHGVKVLRQVTFGDETFGTGTFTVLTTPDYLPGDGTLTVGTYGLVLILR